MRTSATATVRVIGYLLGALLLVVAAVVFLGQIHVSDGDLEVRRSCGSALDVAVGRVGWQQWWNQDLSDPALAGTDRLLRTEECPDAVNRQQVIAGALAIGAAVSIAAAEILRIRHGKPREATGDGLTLDRLGVVVLVLGAVLLLAGLVGIVLLVADPEDTLFLFVSRPTVGLIGLVLLLPAVVLVITGLVLRLTGRKLDERETTSS